MRGIQEYKIVFWDFDGVIKDSVQVKTKAFQELFKDFGIDVFNRVTKHHIDNGGMSRFEKIPLYLGWADQSQESENVHFYCDKFASIVEDKVVSSEWVPGVKHMLNKVADVPNVLVTATPHDEILRIVERLMIGNFFSLIFGAPISKTEGIEISLKNFKIDPEDAIMIGDAQADYQAAINCRTSFLLRRTPENLISMPDYKGAFIYNFVENAE